MNTMGGSERGPGPGSTYYTVSVPKESVYNQFRHIKQAIQVQVQFAVTVGGWIPTSFKASAG
ncbi:hypothetical protein J6590_100032 [Homalodisca vitripennis]|nr:hypothetical protein J6590_100032 [Homalodisca vitripennis]